MIAKTTTLEKQRAAAVAVLGSSAPPAEPEKAVKKVTKKAAKKAVKKVTKKAAKKATKKATKKTKPIGARIKVVKSTKASAKPKAKAKTAKSVKANVAKAAKAVKIAKSKAAKASKSKAAKASKSKAAKASKAVFKSGQSAAAIALDRSALNPNETKVLEALRSSRAALTLVELAKAAFPRKTRAQGNSWVRNAMRRLVRGSLVVKVDRGTYKASPKGLGEDQDRSPVLA